MKHFKDRAFAGGEPFRPVGLPAHGDVIDVRVPGNARSGTPRDESNAAHRQLGAACSKRGLWFDQIGPDRFRVKWNRDMKMSGIVAEGSFAEVVKVVDRMELIGTART
jgi:hypothetical protein